MKGLSTRHSLSAVFGFIATILTANQAFASGVIVEEYDGLQVLFGETVPQFMNVRRVSEKEGFLLSVQIDVTYRSQHFLDLENLSPNSNNTVSITETWSQMNLGRPGTPYPGNDNPQLPAPPMDPADILIQMNNNFADLDIDLNPFDGTFDFQGTSSSHTARIRKRDYQCIIYDDGNDSELLDSLRGDGTVALPIQIRDHLATGDSAGNLGVNSIMRQGFRIVVKKTILK